MPCAAVGAVGTPVNAGLAKGALRARALLIVVLKFGSLLIAAAISLSVSSVPGAPLISAVIADLTKAVFAICVLFVPCAAVGYWRFGISKIFYRLNGFRGSRHCFAVAVSFATELN